MKLDTLRKRNGENMDRRHFMTKGASAVMTTSLAKKLKLFPNGAFSAESIDAAPSQAGSERNAVGPSSHRRQLHPFEQLVVLLERLECLPDQAGPGCHRGSGSGPSADYADMALFSAQPDLGECSAPGAIERTAGADGRARFGCPGNRIYRAVERLVLSAALQQAGPCTVHRPWNLGGAGTHD